MVRWLVVGIGDITTKRVLPAILAEPRSKLAGIVTRTAAKAAPYDVRAWPTLESALAESDADAVYIATPVFLHAPQTIAAFHSGRHVLCEKPMAMNDDEAASMQRAAEETGRIFGVAYYRRLYPKVARAKALIASGAIGRPVFVEATAHAWFYPTDGFREWLIDPQKAAAGPLYDNGSHRIDLMNDFFGKPLRVSSHLSTLVHPIQVEDNATVTIEYENGVRGVVDVRWHSRISRDEFRIRGTEGELDLSPLNGPLLHCTGREPEEIPAHPNLHYPTIENFVDAVLNISQLRSTGATALGAEWVMNQALRSAHITAAGS